MKVTHRQDTLISYFPVCNPLISSSYLIVIAKTLNYVEQVWREWNTCLSPDFSKNALNCSPFSITLTCKFSFYYGMSSIFQDSLGLLS